MGSPHHPVKEDAVPISRVTALGRARAARRSLGRAIAVLATGAVPLLFAATVRSQPPIVRQPCDLAAQRTAAPRVVGAGELVTLTVAWDYRCTEVPQPAMALLLAVEDTAALAGVDGGLPGRLRDGLTRLVDAIDVARGGRLGLMRYGPSGPEWRTPLAPGEQGRTAVRTAIVQLGGRLGGFAHTVSALEDAAAQLIAVPSGPGPTVLLVDSKAPLVTGTSAEGAILRCLALRDDGVRLLVLSLATAARRLEGCALPGDFWASSSPDGHDLPELVDRLSLHLLGDPYVVGSAFTETLAAGWTLVAEGSMPRVPDDILADGLFAWYEPAPAPTGGHRVAYRVRAPAVATSQTAPVSRPEGPRVGLARADGSMLVTLLADPDVCVHPLGEPQGCAEHAANLTATAAGTPPTATPTPALTPPTPTSVFTDVPPTAATPSPSATSPTAVTTASPTRVRSPGPTPPWPVADRVFLPYVVRSRR